jgi:hypothetical protein
MSELIGEWDASHLQTYYRLVDESALNGDLAAKFTSIGVTNITAFSSENVLVLSLGGLVMTSSGLGFK